MEIWQQARNVQARLPTTQQNELETLIEAELLASAERAKAMMQDSPTL